MKPNKFVVGGAVILSAGASTAPSETSPRKDGGGKAAARNDAEEST